VKESIPLFIDKADYFRHKEDLELKMTHYTLKSQNNLACRMKHFKLNPKQLEIRNQPLAYNGP